MYLKNKKLRNLHIVAVVSAILFGSWLLIQEKVSETAFAKKITENESQRENNKSSSIYFEENQGQFNSNVKFRARGNSGYTLFLTDKEAVYLLRNKEPKFKNPKPEFNGLELNKEDRTQNSVKAVAVYMTLVGANKNSNSNGSGKLFNKTNYFKGEESNWKTEIPNFKQVQMENIYDGINLTWQGNNSGIIQNELSLQPNANLNQIELEIEGAENVEIDSLGNLLIQTEVGTIKYPKPKTTRKNNELNETFDSKFKINRSGDKFSIGFELGERLLSEETPTNSLSPNGSELEYSTFLGDSGNDSGRSIAVRNTGDAYITGTTTSDNFPTVAGSIDISYNGSNDVFVTMLWRTGSLIIYSTYLGGNNSDIAGDIAVDIGGNVYVTGSTNNGSTDFPTTSGAFDRTHNGGTDAFVAKLNASGTGLAYSTFIGGSGSDSGSDIVVDSSFNAYISGGTRDDITDYPTTSGAFDTTHNGNTDAFVTKLNPTGSNLLFSTFIGGGGDESGLGITIDSPQNVFITGRTGIGSPSYPTTIGAFDTTLNGNFDGFISKLNASGSSLIYSTFIGGDGFDDSRKIAVDSSGNAFVTGRAEEGFPTTIGAFDTTFNGGIDAYVTKVNSNGSGLVYSTFLGGVNFDDGFDIALDSTGKAIVIGRSQDNTFPTTGGAFNRNFGEGIQDGFVTKLNFSGSALEYSTYLGGSGSDVAFGVATNPSNNVYVTGSTSGSTNTTNNFPTTTGAYDRSYNGDNDVFITKFNNLALNRPTPFDFDGDAKTDISIFRPSVGEWWYLNSSDGSNFATQFGSSTDLLTPADFTGDGKTDIAFFRPASGEWFVLRSEDLTFYSFPFGANGDIPAPGDFDGDGIADTAVFRPTTSTWFILRSSDEETEIVGFGANGDRPVVEDYDGDGKDDIAIFRPSVSQWWINRSTDGNVVYTFGQSGDKTVPADFTGDGKADVAFYRPSNGNWFVLRSEDSSFFSFPFGANGDIPSPGDYDGDSVIDATVFRPSTNTWIINGTTSGVQFIGFGASGDFPIPNAYVQP